MSDLLYDKWREFYLQQLAAGEISTETRQYDLEQMWLSTQLNSKVIRVTEGQSIQAAVDAAVAAGASASNPYVVVYGPRTPPTYTPAPGVWVVPDSPRRSYSNSVLPGIPYREAAPYPVPYNQPMVAIVMDDIDAQWMSAPAGADFGAGVSGFEYAWRNGIPVAHAVVRNYLNAADKFKTRELLACQFYNAAEMLAHSKSHAAPAPVTVADIIDETIAVRDWLESLTITAEDQTELKKAHWGLSTNQFANTPDNNVTTPWTDAGFMVGGFVKPGAWPSGLNSLVSLQTSPIWATVRDGFDYYINDVRFDILYPGPPRMHSITRKLLEDGVLEGCENLIEPGQRTMLLFHAYPAADWAKVKTAFDRLVAARNAGKLQLVTPRTLVYGVPAPVDSMGKWGGIAHGSFTGLTTLGSQQPWDGNGTIEDGDLGKCLKFDHGEWALHYMSLAPGHYMLRFKARESAAGGTLTVGLDNVWLENNVTKVFQVRRTYALTNANALNADPYEAPYPIYVPFFVSRWAQAVRLLFGYAHSGQSCQIDDVELARI